jgi:hypothetical protein
VRLLDYQRFVVAFHGCDEEVAQRVLLGKGELDYSENAYDWLGKGIYFWEYGPRRAYEWAKWRAQGKGGVGSKVKKPAVIGAYINLGRCFDLLDTANTRFLGDVFGAFEMDCQTKGLRPPRNEPAFEGDIDCTRRQLDCAVVNFAVEAIEETERTQFQTVRCIFSKGRPAFEGSLIMAKSHIQIAVRDLSAIVGYFRLDPTLTSMVNRDWVFVW